MLEYIRLETTQKLCIYEQYEHSFSYEVVYSTMNE